MTHEEAMIITADVTAASELVSWASIRAGEVSGLASIAALTEVEAAILLYNGPLDLTAAKGFVDAGLTTRQRSAVARAKTVFNME